MSLEEIMRQKEEAAAVDPKTATPIEVQKAQAAEQSGEEPRVPVTLDPAEVLFGTPAPTIPVNVNPTSSHPTSATVDGAINYLRAARQRLAENVVKLTDDAEAARLIEVMTDIDATIEKLAQAVVA